jgi:hypothetical protein
VTYFLPFSRSFQLGETRVALRFGDPLISGRDQPNFVAMLGELTAQ